MKFRKLNKNTAKRLAVSGLFISLFFYNIYGADNLNHSLRGYIEYALKNNPALKSAAGKIEVYNRKRQNTLSFPDPQIKAGYYISEVETRVGPQQFRFGASQKIPWPGRLYAKHKEEGYNYKAVKKEKEIIRNKLVSDIKTTYSRLYLSGKSIEVNRQSLRLLQHFESVIISKYETGKADQVSVIKIQVEAVRLEDHIKSLETEGVNRKKELRALLSLDPGVEIPYPDTLILNKFSENVEDVLSSLNNQNPILAELDEKINAAQAKESAVRQRFIPDLMISTDYIFTGKSPMSPPPVGNGKDPWIIGASVNLPLYWGKRIRDIENARQLQQIRQDKKENIKNKLQSRAGSLVEMYGDAVRKTGLYEDFLIPRAGQSIRLIEESYKNGEATVLDYLDSQRTLLDLQISLISEKSRRNILLARIEELTAELSDAEKNGKKSLTE